MSDDIKVRLGWLAGQAGDTARRHDHDAHALLDYAHAYGLDLVGASEAGPGAGSSYREALGKYAPVFGYRLVWHTGQDTALLVSRGFGTVVDREFVQVVEPNGRHDPGANFTARGLFTVTVEPHNADLAPSVTVGLSHFLTRRVDPSERVNRLIAAEADRAFTQAARGRRLGFAMGDLNLQDDKVDGWAPAELATCWDDLGTYPATHGGRDHGHTIDVIARYDPDARVRLVNARALYADRLEVFSDHNAIRATYAVAPLAH